MKIDRVKNFMSSMLSSIIVPAINFILSFIVINQYNAHLWGQYIKHIIWLTILAHIITFGSKESIIRLTGQNPNHLSENWHNSYNARFILLILGALIILLTPLSNTVAIISIIWLTTRYVYQSYDALISIKKKMLFYSALELFGGMLLVIKLVINREPLSWQELFMFITIAELIKTIVISIYFKATVQPIPSIKIDFTNLKASNGFFILSFIGLIGSRIDQLIATKYLESSTMAKYQIITSGILIFQGFSYFYIQPYLKNIYRLSYTSIEQLSKKMLLYGILIMVPCMMLFFSCINYYLSLGINEYELAVIVLVPIPIYYYISHIYYLYKLGLEKKVTMINIIIIGINTLILPCLFHRHTFIEIIGWLGIVQLIMVVLILVTINRINKKGLQISIVAPDEI